MITNIPGFEEYLEKEREKSLIKAIKILIEELKGDGSNEKNTNE